MKAKSIVRTNYLEVGKEYEVLKENKETKDLLVKIETENIWFPSVWFDEVKKDGNDALEALKVAEEYFEDGVKKAAYDANLGAALNTLRDKIKEIEEKENGTGWEIENCDEIWFVECDGNVDWSKKDDYDIDTMYSIGNTFSTEEKANEQAFKDQLRRRVERFRDMTARKYENEKMTYHILYNEGEIYPELSSKAVLQYGEVHFVSEDQCKKAIEIFKKELRKWFEMEESIWNA